jgi:hypothetical protein
MQYVHLARPPLLHKGLKSANVLLDLDLNPKVRVPKNLPKRT